MASRLYTDTEQEESRFVRAGHGFHALTERHGDDVALKAFALKGRKRQHIAPTPDGMIDATTMKIPKIIKTIYSPGPRQFSRPGRRRARLNDPDSLALRNAAAHDQTLATSDAGAARAWALRILGNL